MTQKNRSQIETMPLSDVQLDPANVRKHNDRNKQAIKSSLTRFKGMRSIVLTGDNRVIAGNGTVEQARDTDIDEVLVVEPKPNQIVAVRRPDLSASEANAYAIMDNRASDLSEWIELDLITQLEALNSEGLLEFTGFTDDDLSKLHKELGDDIIEAQEDMKTTSIFEIIIECDNETVQKELYDEITKRGYTCRVLTL